MQTTLLDYTGTRPLAGPGAETMRPVPRVNARGLVADLVAGHVTGIATDPRIDLPLHDDGRTVAYSQGPGGIYRARIDLSTGETVGHLEPLKRSMEYKGEERIVRAEMEGLRLDVETDKDRRYTWRLKNEGAERPLRPRERPADTLILALSAGMRGTDLRPLADMPDSWELVRLDDFPAVQSALDRIHEATGMGPVLPWNPPTERPVRVERYLEDREQRVYPGRRVHVMCREEGA